MSTDLALTLINVVCSVILAGIGVEMVNNPPGETAWKKWLYRVLFIFFGLVIIVVTAVQSVRSNAEQQRLRAEAEKTERELSNKVSEQGGKLDAISHFEQQFLLQHPASQDEANKLNAEMALAVIKMAQGSTQTTLPSQPPRLHILYSKLELDGRTIQMPVTAAQNRTLRLTEIAVTNSGAGEARDVAVRLYIGKEIFYPGGLWENAKSDESGFPSALYFGGVGLLIHPQETWSLPEIMVQTSTAWDMGESIPCELKVYYGSSEATAHFSVKQAKVEHQ